MLCSKRIHLPSVFVSSLFLGFVSLILGNIQSANAGRIDGTADNCSSTVRVEGIYVTPNNSRMPVWIYLERNDPNAFSYSYTVLVESSEIYWECLNNNLWYPETSSCAGGPSHVRARREPNSRRIRFECHSSPIYSGATTLRAR
jgi:hypothetical protein